MAFHSVFVDSFDHWSTSTEKYTSGSDTTDLSGTQSRTGNGCLVMQTAGSVTLAYTAQSNFLIGIAYKPSNLTVRDIFVIRTNSGVDQQYHVSKNPDGSISILGGNSPFTQLLAQTGPGILTVGSYAYIEFASQTTSSPLSIVLRVNGVELINTTFTGITRTTDAFQLLGNDGDYCDDLYFGYSDTPSTINADFPGAVQIVAYTGDANETPLQWTPLAGTNYQEISQVPPPGDAAYNSAGSVGLVDQYHLAPLPGYGSLGTFSIKFGQTVISARLDSAGSAGIAPDIGGNIGTTQAITSSYVMYKQAYDVNPVTGLPFTQADFATVFFGPKVTA